MWPGLEAKELEVAGQERPGLEIGKQENHPMKKDIHLKDKDEKGNVYTNCVTCYGGGDRWWGW